MMQRMEFVRAVKSSLPAKSKQRRRINQADLESWGLGNVTLRPYQLEGLSWLAERHASGLGCILGDEMGLGKTLQSISLLLYLCGSEGCSGPFLVLAPLSVIRNWESELTRFAPGLEVVNYSGGKEEREALRQEISDSISLQHAKWDKAKYPFQVMLAHYEVVIRDTAFLQKFPWQCLIVDEGHRLKNSSSVLYTLLREFSVQFSLLLTGTPVQNNLSELYSLLSFVAPKIFPLRKLDTFVTSFSNIKDEEVAKLLHSVLQPFLLRREKNEVLLDLPVKSEVVLYTGLSAVQKKYYKAILMKDIAAFGEAGTKTRLMNILIQLRKCVNHPYLFDGVEPEPFELGEHLVEASGKLFIIDRLLKHLEPRGHRVLLFSQMTRMLDIIQDYLGYRGYSYERLDGSVRGEERFLAVKNFSEDEETFIFLLSTRAGGQGLNLAGADTIIFVDSDFNPQNDLQAAARAHRIGQTRPVKVVRLVCRHTVEEIVLKRASMKLELTSSVIEGGKFSHGTASKPLAAVPESTIHLADILKFGLDNLLQSEEGTVVDEDFESILGRSENRQWVVEEAQESGEGDRDDKEQFEALENMYEFEGEDYSKCNDADKKTFDQLLAEQLKVSEGDLGERVLRSEGHGVPLTTAAVGGLPLASRKRKPLTAEQLEERRRKREENRIKRMKLLEEKERRQLEKRKQQRLEMWRRHSYMSLNLALGSEESESSSEEEEEEEGEEEEEVDPSTRELHYVVGDVTRPQHTGDCDAIVVHCVDDSGHWGRGGLFSALSSRSLLPQEKYEMAGKMKDLSLGDAHIIPIDDLLSRDNGKDMLALIVAQSHGSAGRSSGIKLSALSGGLQRVAKIAKRRKASVHLPRIGHSTPNFNWYGTERLIRKHLASLGIPTYIYYFPRSKFSTVVKKPPPDPCTSSAVQSAPSLLPAGCEPLPNIFTGLVFSFHGVSTEDKKRLSRYIIAYDGDVTDSITMDTTHVLCGDVKMESAAPVDGLSPSMVVISSKWVEACLNQQRLSDETEFVIDFN